MEFPTHLKYALTDEWAKVENNSVTVGVTDYAQEQLSDVVFVEITKGVGESVKKGEVIATVESVKAAADINSPASGKIVEVNENLSQSPELVNSDPYGQAWMVKIEMSNPAEIDQLMDAATYQKYCEERSH